MPIETVKAELRKLSARAIQAKNDLHDLSEDLPVNWEKIPEVARRTHEAYAALAAKRAELQQLEATAS